MREVYVIAYYGKLYTKVFTNGDFKNIYIGEGIVHESDHMLNYPQPADRFVKHKAPKDKEYKYAKIEKRFYPEI